MRPVAPLDAFFYDSMVALAVLLFSICNYWLELAPLRLSTDEGPALCEVGFSAILASLTKVSSVSWTPLPPPLESELNIRE